MIKLNKYNFFVLILLFMVFLIIPGFIWGCEMDADNGQDENDLDVDLEENKKDVELLYVDWECAKASTFIAAVVLEEMGYNVKTTGLTAEVMWERLAEGEGDAFTCAWLPKAHGEFLKDAEGKVEELAVNYDGSVNLGLVVPAYVEMESIEDINDNLDKIDSLIIGIDPRSGIMEMAKKAINEYDLQVELTEGTDSVMTNALKTIIDRNEWIVVTGWTPHWKFTQWDLKFLDDPEGVFGEEEYIATYGRKGLMHDLPEVYGFLKNYHLTSEDMGEVMKDNMQIGSDPYYSARKWVERNPEKVSGWIP